MKELSLVLKFIPLSFSALLPVINLIGSAMLFLGFVTVLILQLCKLGQQHVEFTHL